MTQPAAGQWPPQGQAAAAADDDGILHGGQTFKLLSLFGISVLCHCWAIWLWQSHNTESSSNPCGWLSEVPAHQVTARSGDAECQLRWLACPPHPTLKIGQSRKLIGQSRKLNSAFDLSFESVKQSLIIGWYSNWSESKCFKLPIVIWVRKCPGKYQQFPWESR